MYRILIVEDDEIIANSLEKLFISGSIMFLIVCFIVGLGSAVVESRLDKKVLFCPSCEQQVTVN